MTPRLIRQIVIAVIFITVLGSGSYWYYSSLQVVPTCEDNVQNGIEEGVDCGTVACGRACEPELVPLEVKTNNLLKIGLQDYDFAAEVFNPNRDYGSAESAYELILLNKDGQEVAKKAGVFYILPGQVKYVIITAISTTAEAVSAKFNIRSARWEKLGSLEGMNFLVKNKTYNVLQGGTVSELKALVVNNSDYDFAKVDIGIILFNDGNKILAVNKTDVRTLLTKTERAIEVRWAFPVRGTVNRIDFEISTNLFDNLNYIKRYGSPSEKFQKYY
ncbi:MAG: hypothetical protein A3B99_02860 [Candidatus Yanofskybacteria bacterium RIFCSPHIGHO2_02_FULL_44_12b]|uniref:Glucose/sorbosone dehydrogenase n=1 Tax=Candidatus Yanofskybacteria bacterium GW2011_GWA2_44_9 TaxID=1619025 RepID=A0A0G1KBN1_9BACT|nr:MAG: hypothetical protein UW79_C0025G0005 [Candidatus Yanofskybacteria bacterium GW2011_GWA2_44_9]OGN15941.1 MAG: hypothetical protein A3B99_02860 [Candidatus Yanofskybacteria bacterium RIFCSPHIGHO2_02_FULL_44_12b]